MTANAFGRLVICAPPRALGVLRNHMTEIARQRVVVELDKDIVRDKIRDIDERLKAHKV
jgi:protein required for attachment to host cells